MTAPRTPEFRRWFRASKIVDAHGEPLVVYHGGFDVLNSRAGAFRRSTAGALGAGIYFTPDRSVAEYYAGSQGGHAETGGGALTEVYLSIQNPLVVDHTRGYDPAIEALVLLGEPRARAEAKVERARERSGDVGKTIETAAVKADYDGIIHSIDGEVYEIVAFQPGQVKSATRNAGTYEFFDPDIRRNPASGLDVRPGIPGTYRTTFTDKGGRERAYPAQGGAPWDRTLVRVANETTVASGRVYDTVKHAEHAGHASLRGKRGEVAVTRLTNPRRNPMSHYDALHDAAGSALRAWMRAKGARVHRLATEEDLPLASAYVTAVSLLRDAPELPFDKLERMVAGARTGMMNPETYEPVDAQDVLRALRAIRPQPLPRQTPTVRVYHATDAKTAAMLRTRGYVPETKGRSRGEFAPGKGLDAGLYVGASPRAVESYGRVTLEVEVPREWLTVPTELAQLGERDPMRALQEHDGAVVFHALPPEAFREAGAAPAPDRDAAFRRWFAGSKVVDAAGKPLRVYHGTTAGGFTDFQHGDRAIGLNRLGFWFDAGTFFPNVFAGGNELPRWGDGGGNVLPVYLSLKNPVEYASDPLTRDEYDTLDALMRAKASGTPGEAVPEGEVERIIRRDAPTLRFRPALPNDIRGRIEHIVAHLRRRGWRDAYEKMLRDVLPEGVTPEGRMQVVENDVADAARERLAARHDGIILRSTLTDRAMLNTLRWDHPDADRIPLGRGDNVEHFGSDWYLALRPTQIKSATGNRGTFDAADPDVRHNPRRR